MNIYIVIIFISSAACAIEFEDRVVVTGGYYGRVGTVQMYTVSGPQEQLPDLQTSRYRHACAYYLDSQDRAVSIIACTITSHLTIVLYYRINDNHFIYYALDKPPNIFYSPLTPAHLVGNIDGRIYSLKHFHKSKFVHQRLQQDQHC